HQTIEASTIRFPDKLAQFLIAVTVHGARKTIDRFRAHGRTDRVFRNAAHAKRGHFVARVERVTKIRKGFFLVGDFLLGRGVDHVPLEAHEPPALSSPFSHDPQNTAERKRKPQKKKTPPKYKKKNPRR